MCAFSRVCLFVCRRSNRKTAWAIKTKLGTCILYNSRSAEVKRPKVKVTRLPKPSRSHMVASDVCCNGLCRRGYACRYDCLCFLVLEWVTFWLLLAGKLSVYLFLPLFNNSRMIITDVILANSVHAIDTVIQLAVCMCCELNFYQLGRPRQTIPVFRVYRYSKTTIFRPAGSAGCTDEGEITRDFFVLNFIIISANGKGVGVWQRKLNSSSFRNTHTPWVKTGSLYSCS